MPDPRTIEVIVTWSDPDTQYLGSKGETAWQMTWKDLRRLIDRGWRDDEGNVVTSVTIWPAIPPKEERSAD